MLNHTLPGYSPRELALIALLCRYHRSKGKPKPRPLQALLSETDAYALVTMVGMLRVAEFFERGRHQERDDDEVDRARQAPAPRDGLAEQRGGAHLFGTGERPEGEDERGEPAIERGLEQRARVQTEAGRHRQLRLDQGFLIAFGKGSKERDETCPLDLSSSPAGSIAGLSFEKMSLFAS